MMKSYTSCSILLGVRTFSLPSLYRLLSWSSDWVEPVFMFKCESNDGIGTHKKGRLATEIGPGTTTNPSWTWKTERFITYTEKKKELCATIVARIYRKTQSLARVQREWCPCSPDVMEVSRITERYGTLKHWGVGGGGGAWLSCPFGITSAPWRAIFTPTITEAMPAVARMWSQPKCLSAHEQVKKLSNIYTMCYYLDDTMAHT